MTRLKGIRNEAGTTGRHERFEFYSRVSLAIWFSAIRLAVRSNVS